MKKVFISLLLVLAMSLPVLATPPAMPDKPDMPKIPDVKKPDLPKKPELPQKPELKKPEFKPEAQAFTLFAAKHDEKKLPHRKPAPAPKPAIKPAPKVQPTVRPVPPKTAPAPVHGRRLDLDPRARQRLSGWLSRNGSVSVILKTREGANIRTLTARRVKKGNYYRMRNVPAGTQFTVPNGWKIACVSGYVEGLGSSGHHTREGYVVYSGGQRVLLKNGASDLRIYP